MNNSTTYFPYKSHMPPICHPLLPYNKDKTDHTNTNPFHHSDSSRSTQRRASAALGDPHHRWTTSLKDPRQCVGLSARPRLIAEHTSEGRSRLVYATSSHGASGSLEDSLWVFVVCLLEDLLLTIKFGVTKHKENIKNSN